jgi:hypothetical protein
MVWVNFTVRSNLLSRHEFRCISTWSNAYSKYTYLYPWEIDELLCLYLHPTHNISRLVREDI